MFDVGFAELVLLALVGLLVLGPERLPGVARTLGGLSRKARSSWMNLKRSIEAEIRADELKKPLKQFENEIKQTRDQVNAGVDSFKNRAAAGAAAFTATPASGTGSKEEPTQEPSAEGETATQETDKAPEKPANEP